MDLRPSPEHIAFRHEVRAWIEAAMPEDIRVRARVDAHFGMPDIMRWHKVLYEKGWVAPHWPVEYGGPGLDPTRRFILTEELELAGAPIQSPFGLYMVGPLLMEFGNDAQKQRFLPKILSGDEVWCQGYSEPNAGSDLASLQCRAVDDGQGNLVVTGQKTWTTYAQYADWIFCLVRTDSSGKKQQGISFLLIDMKSPGVTVKPMLTIGGSPTFAETFFDGVVVPKENVVGPMHGGWSVAKALLGHERTLIAAVGQSMRAVRRLKRIAMSTRVGDGTLLDDPTVRDRIARLEVRLAALRVTNDRSLASAQLGHAPGPESSILKLVGTEVMQMTEQIALDLMGHNALAWMPADGTVPALEQWVAPHYCYHRAATIYGGSNEIQKNVIARYILGLPTG